MNASPEADPTVAIARYCEGAGHASRMLAIANALRTSGVSVAFGGGGPGAEFVAMHGYDEHEVTPVDFIGDFQRGRGLLDVIRHSVPALFRRIRDWRRWIRDIDPALLVTDDISAALAARLARQRYIHISHDPAGFYDTVSERYGARIRNRLARSGALSLLQPKVWPGEPVIRGADPIPPLAPLADDSDPSVDVLLVPSAFGMDYDALASALQDAGRDVTLVGGPEWTVKPTLQSHIEAANLVVCSGYSTVMECAVGGTACIVVPTTSEQRGVARAVAGISGFASAQDGDKVLAIHDTVPAPAPQENGVERVVEVVTSALEG